MSVQQENTPSKSKKRTIPKERKHRLWLVTTIFIAIAVAFALIYFLVWRHSESTDNAYVQGNLVQINAQVPATVNHIGVEDTQIVQKGDVLLLLDDKDYRLAYAQAQNQLRQAVRQIKQQQAALAQAQALFIAKKTALHNAKTVYARRHRLAKSHAISQEELDGSKTMMDAAQADLQAALATRNAAQAAIGKDMPLAQQPLVMSAANQMRQSWLNVKRTQIRAPVSGQIAKRNVQLGQKVMPGAPLMVIVPLDELWVDANFKETQLKKLRIGQEVEMVADIYGDDVIYHGKILGMSAGTGSAFSLLPAQNATGNWIKVVQRVPVRISLNEEDLHAHPLRVGLSMTANVNTEQQEGMDVMATTKEVISKNIEETNFTEVNHLIEEIISEAE